MLYNFSNKSKKPPIIITNCVRKMSSESSQHHKKRVKRIERHILTMILVIEHNFLEPNNFERSVRWTK